MKRGLKILAAIWILAMLTMILAVLLEVWKLAFLCLIVCYIVTMIVRAGCKT